MKVHEAQPICNQNGDETLTAKEYLNRVRKQYYIVKQTEREVIEVRHDMLTIKASSLTEKVTGSTTSDLADKYIKIERYLDKVESEWDKLVDMRLDAKAMIKALPDSQQQAVLYARYINCMRWEDIAVEMHYSWKGIFKLHGRALQAFERVHGSTLKESVY
jgi:DNA-directed RNA polymerase specialized sigma24 family protein